MPQRALIPLPQRRELREKRIYIGTHSWGSHNRQRYSPPNTQSRRELLYSLGPVAADRPFLPSTLFYTSLFSPTTPPPPSPQPPKLLSHTWCRFLLPLVLSPDLNCNILACAPRADYLDITRRYFRIPQCSRTTQKSSHSQKHPRASVFAHSTQPHPEGIRRKQSRPF